MSGGYNYGFDIMDISGLPGGTVYPALRRLEQVGLVKSKWEKAAAFAEERLLRKYRLTPQGRDALGLACERYALLERLARHPLSRSR